MKLPYNIEQMLPALFRTEKGSIYFGANLDNLGRFKPLENAFQRKMLGRSSFIDGEYLKILSKELRSDPLVTDLLIGKSFDGQYVLKALKNDKILKTIPINGGSSPSLGSYPIESNGKLVHLGHRIDRIYPGIRKQAELRASIKLLYLINS